MSTESEYNASPEGRAHAKTEKLRDELRKAREINTKQAELLERALGIIAEAAPARLKDFGLGESDVAAGQEGGQ